MKTNLLDRLPPAINVYNVKLENDEKVIFTAVPDIFAAEDDRSLGVEPNFTLTNKRLVVDNHQNIFSAMLQEDVADCEKKSVGKLFKTYYFAVTLNGEMRCKDGHTLSGFRFYFNKKDTGEFEQLMCGGEQK